MNKQLSIAKNRQDSLSYHLSSIQVCCIGLYYKNVEILESSTKHACSLRHSRHLFWILSPYVKYEARYSQYYDLATILFMTSHFYPFCDIHFPKLLICCSQDPILQENTMKRLLAIFLGLGHIFHKLTLHGIQKILERSITEI